MKKFEKSVVINPEEWCMANVRLAIRNESLHLINLDLTHRLILSRSIHMKIHHMSRYRLMFLLVNIFGPFVVHGTRGMVGKGEGTYSISSFVVLVFDNKNHIESRENRSLKVDILSPPSDQYCSASRDDCFPLYFSITSVEGKRGRGEKERRRSKVKNQLTSPGVFISS